MNWLRTISKIPGVTPINRVQVVELYSPERVNKVAKEHGLNTGLSLDLLTGWDFDKEEDRKLAERYVREFKPLFVIGSPMCTMFSQLQALNRDRKGARSEDYEERLRRAEKHMNFAARIYRIQLEGGRYFVHEHPAMATSWKLPCMRRLLGEKGVKLWWRTSANLG